MSQDVFVNVLVNSLLLWQEFSTDLIPWTSNKAISITLVLDLKIFTFLGTGGNVLFHSRLCCFVRDCTQRSITHHLQQLFSASWINFQVAPKCLDTLDNATRFAFQSAASVPFLCKSFSYLDMLLDIFHLESQIFITSVVMILHFLSLFMPGSSGIILKESVINQHFFFHTINIFICSACGWSWDHFLHPLFSFKNLLCH